MHSSRMRTACSLTVSRSICRGGVYATHAPRAMHAPCHAQPPPCMPPSPATHAPPPCHACPPCGQTDTCENIAFANFAGGKNKLSLPGSVYLVLLLSFSVSFCLLSALSFHVMCQCNDKHIVLRSSYSPLLFLTAKGRKNGHLNWSSEVCDVPTPLPKKELKLTSRGGLRLHI